MIACADCSFVFRRNLTTFGMTREQEKRYQNTQQAWIISGLLPKSIAIVHDACTLSTFNYIIMPAAAFTTLLFLHSRYTIFLSRTEEKWENNKRSHTILFWMRESASSRTYHYKTCNWVIWSSYGGSFFFSCVQTAQNAKANMKRCGQRALSDGRIAGEERSRAAQETRLITWPR